MPNIDIELAEREDVPRALALANWAAEHTVANFALGPEEQGAWDADFAQRHATYPWLVARGEGVVKGFAKASPYRARGAYAWTTEVSVYVDEQFHRQGVGRALYEVLFPLLRTQGYVTVLAGITSPHEPSEKLHAAFGFTRCAMYHRVGWKFGRWHDVSHWELPLAGDGPPVPRIVPVRDAWTQMHA